jgi:hypothetical protein
MHSVKDRIKCVGDCILQTDALLFNGDKNLNRALELSVAEFGNSVLYNDSFLIMLRKG